LSAQQLTAAGLLAVAAGALAAAAFDGRSPLASHMRGRGTWYASVPADRARAASAGHPGRRSPVSRLSLRQLAGQRIVYAYSGLTPPSSLLARVRAGEAAGVIFFASNIASRGQLRAVIARLQAAGAASPLHEPLLMMTDQEGGLVRRLPGAPELSERQIGEGADPLALAGQAGRAAGEGLAEAGIDVNLAPVLDVYRRAGDFIDEAQRSYSMDPRDVAGLGGAFIDAQQHTGVAATAKHFPGLGSAESGQDTDRRAITLDLPLRELRDVDERPYRTAIAAGVRLVMTSWAAYPALDRELPAGLSSKVIEGELRGRLGFRGVTITDGLAAEGTARFGAIARRGVLAAHAGADLLLCSALEVKDNTPAEGASVLDGLVRALADDPRERVRAERAAERVLALRAAFRPGRI
jgi:beta-N-acetylhexosaminidase